MFDRTSIAHGEELFGVGPLARSAELGGRREVEIEGPGGDLAVAALSTRRCLRGVLCVCVW